MVKRKPAAAQSWAGIALALIDKGLPLIGVSVDMWLGGFLLTAAFVLIAWGFWNFGSNRNVGKAWRAATLVFAGIIYFGIIAAHIHAQFKKEHLSITQASPASSPSPSPPAPKCDGKTGDATANGTGSIANTGDCVHGLTTGKQK
jgi:hypothetical protein